MPGAATQRAGRNAIDVVRGRNVQKHIAGVRHLLVGVARDNASSAEPDGGEEMVMWSFQGASANTYIILRSYPVQLN